jgi:hypothetical protein
MKNAFLILALSMTLLSCKKSSMPQKQHVFTSNQTVTETITATASISKNSSGIWFVSGSTSASPVIDSLQMSGDVYINIESTDINGYTIDQVITPNVVVGQTFSVSLTSYTFYSTPILTNVFYEPQNTTSLGSILYTVKYQ